MPPTGFTHPIPTLAVSVAVACALFLIARRLTPPVRWLLALATLLTTAALFQSAVVYANATWNSVRVVIPVAWASGVPPVFPPGQGPLWASIYPPLAYALQLPIAWMPSPQGMVYAGQAHGLLLLAAPLVWLLARSPAPGVWAAALGGVAATFFLPGLANAALTVHVDPAAIGLGLLASLCLTLPRRSLPAASWSGALAAASLLCKQTMLPMAVVLAMAVIVLHGRRGAGRWLLGFAGVLLVMAGLVLTQMPWQGLWHNAVIVPSRHPWRSDTAYPLLTSAGSSITSLWALWLTTPVVLWRRVRRRNAHLPADFVRTSALLVLAALALWPAGVAGHAKFGGHVNNFAPTGFFLLAAILPWVAHAGTRPVGRMSAVGWAAVTLAVAASLSRLNDIHRRGPLPPLHDQALAIVRTAPGRVYLPWHPLAHFVAERRLTHQSFGVLDREMAGEDVSDRWLEEHLPADAELIGFDYPPQLPPHPMADRVYERLRDRYPLPATLPGFPGWTFFARMPQ